jgi:ABC-2 type transport system permease protein
MHATSPEIALGQARPPITRINRWLPYWAVFQADVQQTLRNWVYRCWVILSVLTGGGYLLYRYGLAHEAGIVQQASVIVSDLLRWTVLASASLIAVLTAGTISSERGTLADSVLSRGISRYQYFLGKWNARLATVLFTYLVMGLTALLCCHFLLHEDLSWAGTAFALAVIAALLTVVITWGVAVSAVCNSTVLGIAILWMLLYGTGFSLSLLPDSFLSPDRVLHRLPYIVRGHYDADGLCQLIAWSLALSGVSVIAGACIFARRDV